MVGPLLSAYKVGQSAGTHVLMALAIPTLWFCFFIVVFKVLRAGESGE